MLYLSKKIRILVVEDEVVTRMHLRECLESFGYEVAGDANSFDQALEKVASLNPDLVLMDIVLQEEKDGIDAAREIKKRFDIPVVFLTAYGIDKYLERVKEVEPFGYIIKPFKDFEIKAAVELALYKKDIEIKINSLNLELEQKVRQRTKELESELANGKRTMKELAKSKALLKKQADELKKKNIALEILLDLREKDKSKIEDEILYSINMQVFPLLNKIKSTQDTASSQAFLELLEKVLKDITSPLNRKLLFIYKKLSAREIETVNLIRMGKSTKEMAEILHLSEAAIKFHRKNIRKKLELRDRRTSLYSFLSSIKE